LRRSRHFLCVNNAGYPTSLELRKVYLALPDTRAAKHGLLRIVDEASEDYLYPQDFFIPVTLPKAAETVFAVNGRAVE
jgi:hypothetical protein